MVIAVLLLLVVGLAGVYAVSELTDRLTASLNALNGTVQDAVAKLAAGPSNADLDAANAALAAAADQVDALNQSLGTALNSAPAPASTEPLPS